MDNEKKAKRYNVRLGGSIPDRFDSIAVHQGIAPSTLASVIIGEWVAAREMQNAKIKELMSDPDFVKQVENHVLK
jgi:predicted transcriptional regulator